MISDNRSNHIKSYLWWLLLLFYYSFYSFIAIGRIAAIARFHFIRLHCLCALCCVIAVKELAIGLKLISIS